MSTTLKVLTQSGISLQLEITKSQLHQFRETLGFRLVSLALHHCLHSAHWCSLGLSACLVGTPTIACTLPTGAPLLFTLHPPLRIDLARSFEASEC